MKLAKPFIVISVALFVVWTAWSAQGSDQVPQTGLPGETLYSNALAYPLPTFGSGYNAVLPGVNARFHPFFKEIMEETAQQVLPPLVSPTGVWSYKIKDGRGDFLSLQRSFHGYFWDTSGRIKNTGRSHGFADLAYTFGPATSHLYLGHDNAKNNNEWKVGDDDNTRMMYGASIDYKVADAFYVIPVLTYYDWSKQSDFFSKPDINKEWIGGLQFRVVF